MVTNIKKERNAPITGKEDNHSFRGFYYDSYILTYKSKNHLLKKNIDTWCQNLPRYLDRSKKFILDTKYGL